MYMNIRIMGSAGTAPAVLVPSKLVDDFIKSKFTDCKA